MLKVIPHGLGTNRRGALVDESGNAHNAIIKAPVLEFASNDSVSPMEWKDLFGFDYARIVCWFYADSADSSSRFLYFRDFSAGPGNEQIDISITAADAINVVYKGAIGDAQRTDTSSWTVSQDTWHSLIIEIKGGDDQLRIWLDGVRETDATPGAISAWSDDIPSAIKFGDTIAGGDGMVGYMRWLGTAGTDTAITDEDARAYHQSPRTWLSGASMSGYWPCNEGTNATLLDRSGNEHPLAGSGIAWTIDQVPETGVNADTRMGIGTTGPGWIDLVTTDKVSQGTAQTADNASNSTSIIFVGDVTAEYVVNNVVQSPDDSTWHRITASTFGATTEVTVDPAPTTAATWDGETIQAYKGQIQLLTEDAFAICLWWLPPIKASGSARVLSNELDNAEDLLFYRGDTNNRHKFDFHGTSNITITHNGHKDGIIHSFVMVADNQDTGGSGDAFSWIDKVDPQTDTDYSGLHGGQPEFIRLGRKAFTADSSTDSFGSFCLIDLSDITGGVDQEVREGIRDAFHDADMDWEVFFADLLTRFDAWTGPSDTDTITVTYWKLLDVVPYGQEIDTDNIISRFTRVITRGAALPAEGAADATDSDTENCTGIPLDTLGDSFKGSAYWMDEAQVIDFGDHADFSFNGTTDQPFSYMVWSDADLKNVAQSLLLKTAEYSFVIGTDGKITATLTDAESDTISTVSNAVLADGTLHCWTFVYDGDGADGSDLSIYEDGVLVASTDAESGVYGDMPNTANSLEISGMARAHIYNSQIFGQELSANEVLSLFRNSAYR